MLVIVARRSGTLEAVTMNQYRVIFYKYLLSSDGHPFKCVQSAIDIRRAKSAERAIAAAERRYERSRRATDWRLYADCLELENSERS